MVTIEFVIIKRIVIRINKYLVTYGRQWISSRFLHLFSISPFYYEVLRELYNVIALRIHYLDRR